MRMKSNCEVNKGIIAKIVFLQKEYLIIFIIIENINYDMILGNGELAGYNNRSFKWTIASSG